VPSNFKSLSFFNLPAIIFPLVMRALKMGTSLQRALGDRLN